MASPPVIPTCSTCPSSRNGDRSATGTCRRQLGRVQFVLCHDPFRRVQQAFWYEWHAGGTAGLRRRRDREITCFPTRIGTSSHSRLRQGEWPPLDRVTLCARPPRPSAPGECAAGRGGVRGDSEHPGGTSHRGRAPPRRHAIPSDSALPGSRAHPVQGEQAGHTPHWCGRGRHDGECRHERCAPAAERGRWYETRQASEERNPGPLSLGEGRTGVMA